MRPPIRRGYAYRVADKAIIFPEERGRTPKPVRYCVVVERDESTRFQTSRGGQLTIFNDPPDTERLSNQIAEHFAGTSTLARTEVDRFVTIETDFCPGKHVTDALKVLQQSGRLEVSGIAGQRAPKRGAFPPGKCMLRFSV